MGMSIREAYDEARNNHPFRRANDVLVRLHEDISAVNKSINASGDLGSNVYHTTKIEDSRFCEILYMQGKQPRVFFLEAKHDGTLQLDLLKDLDAANPSYITASYSVDDANQMESLENFLGRTLDNFARQAQGIPAFSKPHLHLVSA
jgi:hypothetical protein